MQASLYNFYLEASLFGLAFGGKEMGEHDRSRSRIAMGVFETTWKYAMYLMNFDFLPLVNSLIARNECGNDSGTSGSGIQRKNIAPTLKNPLSFVLMDLLSE